MPFLTAMRRSRFRLSIESMEVSPVVHVKVGLNLP